MARRDRSDALRAARAGPPMTVVPVVLCGGAGSRLWPLSRDACPKPFVELPDGTRLIDRTYARATRLGGVGRIVTVTGRDCLFLASDACERAGAAAVPCTFLLEPAGRDTAAAVALAALHVRRVHGDDAVLLALPADHLVRDEAAWAAAVTRAVVLAGEGRIVTFGIAPDRPETGYGYIEVDGEAVLRFVEKPDAAAAAAYLAGGRHRWNAGMVCFRAAAMLDAMARHCSDVLAGAGRALDEGQAGRCGTHETIDVASAPFLRTPAISLDYAVLEKADDIACVSVDCGWADAGSWPAVIDMVEPDAAGNRTTGEVVAHAARDCFVHSGRLVGLVGVSDLLVVDTPDALLVANRAHAQEIGHVYRRLKAANHPAVRLPRTVHRPWGTYTVLEEGERFKIKRIEVKPGGRLSLQLHRHRSEHWVVVCGTARVTSEDGEVVLSADQSTCIPGGHRHRLENPGDRPLVMIEVQCGDYLGEDDIVRLEDAYGRC